jgi:hypothetical protein
MAVYYSPSNLFQICGLIKMNEYSFITSLQSPTGSVKQKLDGVQTLPSVGPKFGTAGEKALFIGGLGLSPRLAGGGKVTAP